MIILLIPIHTQCAYFMRRKLSFLSEGPFYHESVVIYSYILVHQIWQEITSIWCFFGYKVSTQQHRETENLRMKYTPWFKSGLIQTIWYKLCSNNPQVWVVITRFVRSTKNTHLEKHTIISSKVWVNQRTFALVLFNDKLQVWQFEQIMSSKTCLVPATLVATSIWSRLDKCDQKIYTF